MRRPGFAVLEYEPDAAGSRVRILRKFIVDNKRSRASHGQMLSQIAREIKSYFTQFPALDFLIRERAFLKGANETMALAKVAGVADLYAWAYFQKDYIELPPAEIKKLVAGTGKATKEEVAAALAILVSVMIRKIVCGVTVYTEINQKSVPDFCDFQYSYISPGPDGLIPAYLTDDESDAVAAGVAWLLKLQAPG